MRVRELRIQYRPRSDLPSYDGRTRLKNASAAANILRPILESEPVEVFGVLLLSTKHQLIAWHEVSRGALDATLVHPREVFKAAILGNAAAVIAAHNHPSGDPSPSPDDAALTSRLKCVGDLVGIDLLDSIVIGHDGQYFSFREGGRL